MQGIKSVWRALPAGVFLGASLFLGACGGGGGGGGDNAIDPADADALTQALAIKVGESQAVLVAGDLPASSEDDAAPVVVPGDVAVDARAGSTVDLAVDVTSSDGADLSALFAKVPGAADYFQATLAPGGSKRLAGGKLLTALVVSVTLPQNVRDGRFCFSIKVADSTGLISNLAEVCVDVGEPDDSGAQVVEALQGTWYFACNVGDGESFSGSLEVSGNTITTTESLYLNTDCSGSPVDSYQETLEFAVGAQAQASDGGDAFEIDITNLSEGGTALCLIRVEQSRFLLGCGDESVRATVLENEFTREPTSSNPTGFSNAFVSGRAFYLDVPGSNVAQLTFGSDGSGGILFSPDPDNSYSTGDVNSIAWLVASDGTLEVTEFGGDGDIYDIVFTPDEVTEDSATFSYTVAENGTPVGSASGSMQAADADLYAFLAGRAFTTGIPDVERLSFDPEGTGSIRFAPSEFNDFDPNDVNGQQWEAVSANVLRFVEFGGDGFDRDETGCEINPQIDCELTYYEWELTFSQIGADTASLSYTVRVDGGVVESGSGSLQAEGPAR